jgi:rRNA-processing protein FCF1
MKKILLDTNFFLAPFQLGINIFTEFDRIMEEPYVMMTIGPVKKELEKIAKSGKGDDKAAARLGVHLARNIEVAEAEGKADDAIVDYMEKDEDLMVATNDSGLRKRLKKGRCICVRHKSKLEIV